MATPPIQLAQLGQSQAAATPDPMAQAQSLVPSAPSADHGKLARWIALGGGAAADGITTRMALSANPNAYEANSMIGGLANHTAALMALKGATAVGEGLALDELAKKHPTLANVFAGVISGLQGAVALHNLKAAKK